MTDRISKKKRSWNMSLIRSKNTKPEIIVRSLLHRMGYRFRICRKDLPGTPDIVLPKYHTVVFVHGCFWHRHEGCSRATTPASNVKFWTDKFRKNQARDKRVVQELKNRGWNIITVWECEITKNNIECLKMRLKSELDRL